MIDLHCHILPGVDDGADSLGTALAMARVAAGSGIDTIVATPHCNAPGKSHLDGNFRSRKLDGAFAALQDAFKTDGLPVGVLPGCELLLYGNVDKLLERPVCTLAESRYLLVEFFFDEHPRAMDDALATVAAHGYVPVVAHPERYFCVQDLPQLVRGWFDRGYVIQLNKDSILGNLGEGAYDVSRQLLRERLCHVIASDAHHNMRRRPTFEAVWDELEYCFPTLDPALLLEKNPRKIIGNHSPQAL